MVEMSFLGYNFPSFFAILYESIPYFMKVYTPKFNLNLIKLKVSFYTAAFYAMAEKAQEHSVGRTIEIPLYKRFLIRLGCS